MLLPRQIMRRLFLALLWGFSGSTTVGCASTGATFRSGVGDAYLERAPWVAGRPVPSDRGSLLVLPVQWQASLTQPVFMDPDTAAGSPLAALRDSVQQALSRAKLGPSGTALRARGMVPPDVAFGCALILDECDPQYAGQPLGRQGLRYRLAVGRPSEDWRVGLREQMAAAGATHALLLTLELAPWPVQQRGLRGTKVVPLGVGYDMELPWLTSLETPVQVLQLTAVVVDRDGQAVRIAAEGLQAKRTSLALSAIGAEALLQDRDVAAVLGARRHELDGHPFVWQVATQQVLTSLGLR